jgi:hypothetical protein
LLVNWRASFSPPTKTLESCLENSTWHGELEFELTRDFVHGTVKLVYCRD